MRLMANNSLKLNTIVLVNEGKRLNILGIPKMHSIALALFRYKSHGEQMVKAKTLFLSSSSLLIDVSLTSVLREYATPKIYL